MSKWLAACLGLSLASTFVATFRLFTKSPHGGGWDSWAIWNLKARFLVGGGDEWTAAFSKLLAPAHPDYPLLIPCSIGRSWLLLGETSPWVPALIGLAFTLCTLATLISALMLFRSQAQGILAGCVLLAAPLFISNGASQYADVPIGFFMLATIALMGLRLLDASTSKWCSIQSGLACGLAGWTKNEGILFLLVVCLVLLSNPFWKEKATPAKHLKFFLAGLLPILLVLVFFKMQFAPANDLVAGQSDHNSLALLVDYERHLLLLRTLPVEFFTFGNSPFYIGSFLGVLFLVLGTQKEYLKSPIAKQIGLILLLQLAGYYGVYLTTPLDLQGHLNSSVSRLICQIWPSFLLLYFLILRTPEELLAP